MKFQSIIIALVVSSAIAATCEIQKEIPIYTKCDQRWGSKIFKRASLCTSGAPVAILASALAFYGKTLNGQPITPATIQDKWSKPHVDTMPNFYWIVMELMVHKLQPYDPSRQYQEFTHNAVCQQKLVILNYDGNSSIVKKSDENGVEAIDSDGKTSRISYSEIKSCIIITQP